MSEHVYIVIRGAQLLAVGHTQVQISRGFRWAEWARYF